MSQKRRAFNLLEVVVVMVIIAVVGAISVGSIKLMYADEPTLNASDSIRAQWAVARSRAIDDGVPYQFGVVWNESTWRIAPEGSEFWDTGASTTMEGVVVGNLNESVRFMQSGAERMGDNAAPSPDPGTVEVSRFFRLVTFYPDGSVHCDLPDGSSPDVLEISLEGKTKRRLILSLRSMTGATTTTWEMAQ